MQLSCWRSVTYLPTFLLALEEDDVEEVKLYDFDWTVPPEIISKSHR